MAFCPNCGTQADGAFCPSCGSQLGGGAAGAAGAGSIPTAQPIQAAGMSENMAGALCYLLGIITGILFLVLAPYNQNKLIRFHAFQSIFYSVAYIAVWIVATILSIALGTVPVIGFIFSVLLHLVIGLAFFIGWLVLMFKAYNGQKLVLPIVGPLAEKQA